MRRRLLVQAVVLILTSVTLGALSPELLQSIGAVPAHVAGRFREPRGFGQADAGHYLIFDRRAHAVFGIDEAMSETWSIVEIGAEPGRIIEPTAFATARDGSFVVADAPRGQGRVQLFSSAGQLITSFLLPGEAKVRLAIDGLAANGVGALQYSGHSILLSQPEWGGLVTEYSTKGEPIRTFGRLRATGHEHDPDVHAALNSGIALPVPGGGCFFVFLAGAPTIQRYDADGSLIFERHVEGRELDALVASLPSRWPRGADELPVITPTVRAAAVDAAGHLWVSFSVPYTYVFDADGDKVRVVQFRAGGLVSPTSLVFGKDGRLLVTPGLLVFDPATTDLSGVAILERQR